VSTLKSSAEDLTLNADGSNNDIIFQSNGSNIATLDQAGLFTATTFSGSDASLTGRLGIDEASPTTHQICLGADSGSGDSEASSGISFRASATENAFSIGSIGGGDNSARGLVFKREGTQKFKFTDDGLLFGTDTAAANALGDYEEGTWTPAYSATGLSVSYNTQVGKYTKIGRLVTVSMVLVISSSSGNSASESIKVTGLPFTAGSSAGGARAAAAYGWDADKPDVGQISGTEVLFIDSSGNWCKSDSLQTSNDRGHMYFNFSYQTS